LDSMGIRDCWDVRVMSSSKTSQVASRIVRT
jgi:hypothetical protein